MISAIHLVPLSLASGEGLPPLSALDGLSASAARSLSVSCHVETQPVTIDYTFDAYRMQAWSTPVLARLKERNPPSGVVVLGVTALDLYVPVLTFVFGEAQLAGPAAVISTHRLRDEYYGLPPNEEALSQRLFKELLHEVGHTQGLKHCTDWRCVMSSAHAVERIDLRQAAYCRACAALFLRR
ncbi:archaemetzincin [uncultured Paludibaculum sp.]|uniref:archaemetzincin n=1 Tax=uncultured Paludibaculum sp. TaxID=1765020 RepID=UPI002AABB78A|nr:archaemetzincin [uncultured Paludibaculum sp.]